MVERRNGSMVDFCERNGSMVERQKRSRSFRSDEAKAEEPERTLFVSGAERIGLPCHGRHVLSSRLPTGFNIFPRDFFAQFLKLPKKIR